MIILYVGKLLGTRVSIKKHDSWYCLRRSILCLNLEGKRRSKVVSVNLCTGEILVFAVEIKPEFSTHLTEVLL